MSENCKSNNCPMANRISALEKSNEQHGNTHREIFGRLNTLDKEAAIHNAQYTSIMDKLESIDNKHDKMAEKMESMARDNALQTQNLNALNEKSKQNSAKLAELEAKPGKKWEEATGKFMGGIIGAIATLLVGGIILLLAFASGLINLAI